MIIKKPATIISKRETVISAPDAVMYGPHIIIDISDATISVVETVISATGTPISRADIVNCAFDTSFFAAEMDRACRLNLADAIMIENNHLRLFGSTEERDRTQKRR